MDMYSFDHISFLVLIGSCPSPGGSRSPLARTVSHISLEVVFTHVNLFLVIKRYIWVKECVCVCVCVSRFYSIY